ncbi:MAG TPA: hypothetical protein VKY74_27375, partial [Chloroflexia bacterium]|nr:hypothetical protein [Chloroflexia bacterium]
MSRFSLTPATVTTLLIVCPALAGILLSLGGWELGGQLWLSFAAQMVVLVLVLAIPTVGSLLGAWLLGFRFVLWIVGPLRLARPANRLILGRNDSWQAYGGTVLCVPTRFSPDVARRLAYYTAAGPLLGLLIGIVCTLLLVSPGPAGAADAFPASYLHVVLLVLGPGLLLLILVWGLRAAALITTYLKSGPATDRRIACLALTAQSSAGQRPREWSAPWIDQALSLPDRSLPDVSAHLLAYYHALDGGAVEAAGAHLDYAVAASGALPTLYRPGIYTEAAYFIARYRNDPATARALLDKSGGHTVTPADRCRAEAAVLLGEGRRAEAAVRAGEGLTLLGRDWNAGTAQAERDWLQEIVSVTSADGPAARAPLVARPARWPWPALLIGSVGVAGLAVAGGLLFPGVQAKAVASLPFQGQCVAATDSGTV